MAALCGAAAGLSVALPTTNTPRSITKDLRFVDAFGRVNYDRFGYPMPVNPYTGFAEIHDITDRGALAACWSLDAPPTPEEAQKWLEKMPEAYAGRYNFGTRWAGTVGDPITLTWSLVPDGLAWDGGASNLFAQMDSKFGGNRALWITLIEASFARWSALSGISYTRITTGGNDWDDGASFGSGGNASRGTIRIGMRPLDGTNGVLAYNYFPSNGDMVLDSSENWALSSGSYRSFRNVFMHEHGHGLGFAHTCPVNNTKLMEPGTSLPPPYDGPQQDDIRLVQARYGDPYEPNNVVGLAHELNVVGGSQQPIAPGSTLTLGNLPTNYNSQPNPANATTLSLDANGEVDFFNYQVSGARLVTLTATPIGSTYNEAPQNQNGSCAANSSTNALAIADIVLDAQTSVGIPIVSQNATAAGSAETISNLLVPSGVNVIRVAEANAPDESQLYRLTVQVLASSFSMTASDGTFADFVRCSWSSVPGATQYRLLRNTTNSRTGSTTVYTGTDLTFDDPAPASGPTYYYWVDVQQTVSGAAWKELASDTGARSDNTAPIANAGPDLLVIDTDRNGSESATVDGSSSSDAEGPIAQWQWFRGVSLVSTQPTYTDTFPLGSTLVLLTVRDSGNLSNTDSTFVTVTQAPLANAGSDQTVTDVDNSGSESVQLDGSASSDDAFGSIVSYTWRLNSIEIATGVSPSVNLDVGTHDIELTVADNFNLTGTDMVQITVEAGAPPCPACAADYDNNGGVDGGDLAAFFSDFEAGAECADVDLNGGVDGGDLATFFGLFEAGGC
jgi:hypothetical protein